MLDGACGECVPVEASAPQALIERAEQKRGFGRSAVPVALESAVLQGVPRDEIVRDAHVRGADLVVVGARGLGAFDALLLGRVSLAVAHHADCPVLVVKGQGHRPERLVVASRLRGIQRRGTLPDRPARRSRAR